MRTEHGPGAPGSAIRLRFPTRADADAIRAVDTEGLATGHASFRTTPYDWQSFTAAFPSTKGLARVAETPDGILGWAGVSQTSARSVYAGVGEVSVYIAARARNQGVGRILLDGMIQASEEKGYWTLMAQIFPENQASIALHLNSGFRVVGKRERLGQMTYGPFQGQWRDVVMLERRSSRVGTTQGQHDMDHF